MFVYKQFFFKIDMKNINFLIHAVSFLNPFLVNVNWIILPISMNNFNQIYSLININTTAWFEFSIEGIPQGNVELLISCFQMLYFFMLIFGHFLILTLSGSGVIANYTSSIFNITFFSNIFLELKNDTLWLFRFHIYIEFKIRK